MEKEEKIHTEAANLFYKVKDFLLKHGVEKNWDSDESLQIYLRTLMYVFFTISAAAEVPKKDIEIYLIKSMSLYDIIADDMKEKKRKKNENKKKV